MGEREMEVCRVWVRSWGAELFAGRVDDTIGAGAANGDICLKGYARV
jgi:hypothetical protein